MSRPVLVSHARLRIDRRSFDTLLLLPERGLVLNHTAVAILKLCTGKHTVETIVDHLKEAYTETPAGIVSKDVMTFLHALTERGLLRETVR